jgi:FkbM family methyltransferase
MLLEENIVKNKNSKGFCKEFLEIQPEKRFVLGTNIYAQGIANNIEISGYVDDFTSDSEYMGKPVIKSSELPEDAMVVSSLLGRPLTGKAHLDQLGVKNIDYFAFYEDSGLELPALRFWGRFGQEYELNKEKFKWVEELLADEESRETFEKIMSFRLSGNLSYMDGFVDRQDEQYFESFLELQESGEIFVDIGAFDGFTSQEFIRQCPDYDRVYLFEPDEENMARAKERLHDYTNIEYFKLGLSDHKGEVHFSSDGSVSSITEDGDIVVNVDKLDSLVSGKVTFLKMDIEGSEELALDGARRVIHDNHPRLALSVYHFDSDFWSIPEKVFSIRDDYKIYMRHYTEGVAETVMFFIPAQDMKN